jgi:hypothetical protein
LWQALVIVLIIQRAAHTAQFIATSEVAKLNNTLPANGF